VIWATGFRSDFSWVKLPGVLNDGHVIHWRGVTGVSGLYFLGLSWQHTRGSALLGFVNDDAEYLAERIATFLGDDTVQDELADGKVQPSHLRVRSDGPGPPTPLRTVATLGGA